ncbi:MAG: hypothetical protein L5655_11975 [Thermosediminibacteraceae bacterium]|nr:hypothetical protein [Thermosediminibacteraceae bacterium]
MPTGSTSLVPITAIGSTGYAGLQCKADPAGLKGHSLSSGITPPSEKRAINPQFARIRRIFLNKQSYLSRF